MMRHTKYLSLFLLWPLVGGCLITALWLFVARTSAAEQTAATTQAMRNVESLSDAYAKQMLRSLEKVDELTAVIKFFWEHGPNAFDLNELHARGLFSLDHKSVLVMLDANGDLRSATFPTTGPSNFSDRPHFIHHRDDPSDAIWIGTPTVGRLIKRPVIQVTRRLNKPDGSFDGDLIVGVTNDFFTPASNGTLFGKGSAQALIGDDGKIRVALLGNELKIDAKPALRIGAGCAISDRAARIDGGCFSDDQARYVAVTALGGYPYKALVGLSEAEILAPVLALKGERTQIAWISTLLILVFSAVGLGLSMRLYSRRAEASQVRMAYRLATENGKDGFYLYHTVRDANNDIVDFRIVDCNEQAARFVGSTKARLIGSTFTDHYGGSPHQQMLVASYRHYYELGEGEDEYEVPPGSIVTAVWMRRKFVRTIEGLAVTMQDISDKVANDIALVRLANHDELTKLPNRNWLMQALPALLAQAQREGTQLAVLFLDLNNFKSVNDTLGHAVGDQVLAATAAKLISLVRPHDHVVRLGGDEFTILLRHIDNHETVAQTALRISNDFRSPLRMAEGERRIGVSIGIALFPADGTDASALLKHADMAMYEAKIAKGSHSFYAPSMSTMREGQALLEEDLSVALEQDQFQVYYQPRVCTATGALVGMEALVRWISPQRGFVAPNEFIPLAETSDLIIRIGEVVAQKVAVQLRSWIDAGISVVPISVNVSAKQFNAGQVATLFKTCAEHAAIAPQLLEVELTESAMMGNFDLVANQIAALSALGIKTHVDDFGTGYSSLALLQSLSLDVLKIDRAFTANLGVRADSEILFHAIIAMAHSLGMTVVAEGVETQQQLDIARRLSCDEVQGYLISKPVPASAAEELLRVRQAAPSTLTPV